MISRKSNENRVLRTVIVEGIGVTKGIISFVLCYLISTTLLSAAPAARSKLGLEPPSVIWGQVLADDVDDISVAIRHSSNVVKTVPARKWEVDDNLYYRVHLPASFDLTTEASRSGGILSDEIEFDIDGTKTLIDTDTANWNNSRICRLDIKVDKTIEVPQAALIDTNVWIFEADTDDSSTANDKAAANVRALLRKESGVDNFELSFKRVLSSGIEEMVAGTIDLTSNETVLFNKRTLAADDDEIVFAGHWLCSALPVAADDSIGSVSRNHYYGVLLNKLFLSYGGAPEEVNFSAKGTFPVSDAVTGTSVDGALSSEKSEFAPSSVTDGDILNIALTSTAGSGVTTCTIDLPVLTLPANTKVFATEILSLAGFISKDGWEAFKEKSEINIKLSHGEVDGSSESTLSLPFTYIKVTSVMNNGEEGYFWKGSSYLDINGGLDDGKLISISLNIEGDIPSDGDAVITVEEVFLAEPLAELTVY